MRYNLFRLLEDGNWECIGMFCNPEQVLEVINKYPLDNIHKSPCTVPQILENGQDLVQAWMDGDA